MADPIQKTNSVQPVPTSRFTGLNYVKLLTKHEIAIAELYEAFRVAFPEHQEFWEELVQEELAHAQVLQELGKKIGSQALQADQAEFNMHSVMESVEFISNWLAVLPQKKVSMRQALKIALTIEKSIIEIKFFTFVREDSPYVKNEFDALRIHTQEHIRRLKLKAKELLIFQ